MYPRLLCPFFFASRLGPARSDKGQGRTLLGQHGPRKAKCLETDIRRRASFDPPVETGGSEFYVYKYSLSSAPPKSANMVYHNPLPLALDKGQHVSGVPTITIDYTVPGPKET